MTQDYGGKFLQDSLKDYIEEPLKKFISENPSFVGLLILIQTSLILILASVYFLLSGPSSFGKFGFDIGKALLISAFAGFVCTYFVHERSSKNLLLITENFADLSGNMENSIKSCINDGNMETYSDRFIASFLDSDLVLTKGLVKVHSSRAIALNRLNDKMKELKNDPEVNLYLCGITLKNFFNSSESQTFKTFKEWLNETKNLKAHVIILDKDSEAAKERAIRENPETCFIRDDNTTELDQSIMLFNDLIQTEKNANKFLEIYPNKISIKETAVCPVCFLAVVNDLMIMEPYNYAVRGGFVPVFEIKRTSNSEDLFHTYMRHFSSLWIKPCHGCDHEKKRKMIEDLKDFTGDFSSSSKLYKDLPWEPSNRIEICEN